MNHFFWLLLVLFMLWTPVLNRGLNVFADSQMVRPLFFYVIVGWHLAFEEYSQWWKRDTGTSLHHGTRCRANSRWTPLIEEIVIYVGRGMLVDKFSTDIMLIIRKLSTSRLIIITWQTVDEVCASALHLLFSLFNQCAWSHLISPFSSQEHWILSRGIR